MNKIKAFFQTRSLRAGGYSVLAAALAIVLAIIVNAIAASLPDSLMQADLTADGLYTLSEQSKRIAHGLNQDVTLYYIAVKGNEDSGIQNLLNCYAAESSHILIQQVDPVENPNFTKTYTDSATQNSVVVTNGTRSRYVDYYDIYQQVESEYYDTYIYYAYYTDQYDDLLYDWVFSGENALTGAINYVTQETLPVLYTLSGHGEESLSETVQAQTQQENFEIKTLSLLTESAVPEDAAAIIIHAPQKDISGDEAELLLAYLQNGGKLLLISQNIAEGEQTNLLSLASYMGMAPVYGIVADNERAYRSQVNLLPEYGDHEIVNPISEADYYILYPSAQGIVNTETADSYSSLLYTSSNSYNKVSGTSARSYAKAEGDEDGPFDVAACTENGNAKMVWFTSPTMLSDSVNYYVSGTNRDLFLNAMNWMAGTQDKISLRSKSLETDTLTVTVNEVYEWSIFLIAVVPLALIAVGIIIIIRRKRK